MKVPTIRVALAMVVAPLPKLDAAELIPDVEMIQVEMLGTVNMQMAPITNTMMTVPNDRIPFPANAAIFAISAAAPLVPTSSWYLLISEVSAYCSIRPHRYIIKYAIPEYKLTETKRAIQVLKLSRKAGRMLTATENGPNMIRMEE